MALVIAPWEPAHAQEIEIPPSNEVVPAWGYSETPVEDSTPEPTSNASKLNYDLPVEDENTQAIQVWGGVSDVNAPRQWKLIGILSGNFESRPISEATNLDSPYWGILYFPEGKAVQVDQIPLSWGSAWRYEVDEVRNPTLYGASGGVPVHFAFATTEERGLLLDKTILYPSGAVTVVVPEIFLLDVVASKPIAGVQNCTFPFAVTRIEVGVGFAEVKPVPLYSFEDSPTSQDCYVYLSLDGPPPGEAFTDPGNEIPIACIGEDAINDESCFYREYEYTPSPDDSGEEVTSPPDEKKCVKIVPTFDEDGNLIGNEEIEEECTGDTGGLTVGELPGREYPPLDDAPQGTMNVLNLLGKKRFTPPSQEGGAQE